MHTNDILAIEVCRTLLKQAAWRLQYRMRVQHSRELFILQECLESSSSFDKEVISDIFVQELIKEIPWEKCRYIILKIIIEGKTEKEVANELKISQQGVSKWKMKGMKMLYEKLSRLSS